MSYTSRSWSHRFQATAAAASSAKGRRAVRLLNSSQMSKTKSVTYQSRGFWAYDVAVGIFLKHLIDAAQSSAEAEEPWLLEAMSSWRFWAVIPDIGVTLDERWSKEQQQTFIAIAEQACTTLAARDAIAAQEIYSWPLADDLHVHVRGAKEVATAPVVELGLAMIALLRGKLPEAPKGEAWFYGTPEGRSTIRMDITWDGRW